MIYKKYFGYMLFFCNLVLFAGAHCFGMHEENPSRFLYENDNTNKRTRSCDMSLSNSCIYENDGNPFKKIKHDWFGAAKAMKGECLWHFVTTGQDINEQDANGNTALMVLSKQIAKFERKVYCGRKSYEKKANIIDCLSVFLSQNNKHVNLLTINKNNQNVLDILKIPRQRIARLDQPSYLYTPVKKSSKSLWAMKQKLASCYCSQRIKKQLEAFNNRPEYLKARNFR